MADRDEPHELLSQLYVLRLWREVAGAPWRAMLRPADGGPRLGFADLEQLAIFLLRHADRPAPPVRLEGTPGDNDRAERME
jgi:hypothetical protein